MKNNKTNLPDLIQSENILNEGKLFAYEGKILAVPKQMIENYENGNSNLPFVYDITTDLKEHVPNKDKTCIEALEELKYVAAEKIEDKKFIQDFQESMVARNKEGLDKFHAYLLNEKNDSDIANMKMFDESNNKFYNSLDQGFKPKDMRDLDKKQQLQTIEDIFKYQQF